MNDKLKALVSKWKDMADSVVPDYYFKGVWDCIDDLQEIIDKATQQADEPQGYIAHLKNKIRFLNNLIDGLMKRHDRGGAIPVYPEYKADEADGECPHTELTKTNLTGIKRCVCGKLFLRTP